MTTIFKRIELKLRCELTETELLSRGVSMADTSATISEVKRARAEKAKEFKELLDGLEERQRELGRAIRTGVEERLVPCRVNYHDPREATKTIIRLDTGEVVEECAMTAEECQTRMFAAPEVIEQPTTAELEQFHTDGQDARTEAGEILHEQLEGSHKMLDEFEHYEAAIGEQESAEAMAPAEVVYVLCPSCRDYPCVCVEATIEQEEAAAEDRDDDRPAAHDCGEDTCCCAESGE